MSWATTLRGCWGSMSTTADQTLRLFVAVELDEGVRRALAALQDDLRRRGLADLRWVRPEGVHLTLKFLGETPADKLPAIQGALTAAVAGIAPQRLRLGELGTFGSRHGPQVLWVDLEGDVAELARLARRVDEALEPLGFAREKREFAAHLTLARVRPQSAREAGRLLAEALPAVRAPDGEAAVREVSLMRSTLGPGGAVYERLATFPLTTR